MNPVFLGILELIRGQIDNIPSLSSFDTKFFLEKINEFQSFLGTLSQDGPVASAHVILLAAGVVIFLGVAG
ncbi:MAG: peptidase, partial [Nitrosopumilaceae archaeon]